MYRCLLLPWLGALPGAQPGWLSFRAGRLRERPLQVDRGVISRATDRPARPRPPELFRLRFDLLSRLGGTRSGAHKASSA